MLRAGLTVAGVLLGASCYAGSPLISRDVQKQLALPEHRIDVGIAALTMAKDAYPELDIQAYSKKLDDLADKIRFLARGTRDPETRIRAMNTVLFRQEGFRYDHAGFAAGGRIEHYYLNGILNTKLGTCFSMPLLYVAIGQRVGYPLYPVTAPDHNFVRYADPFFARQNIEVTSGGKFFTDQSYIDGFSIGPRAIKSGGYMRTLSYREYLAHILFASVYAFKSDGLKALAYVEKAAAMDPKDPDFHYWLGMGYSAKAKVVNSDAAAELLKMARRSTSRATQLGYVSPDSLDLRKIRGLP